MENITKTMDVIIIESRIFHKLVDKIDKIYEFISLRQSIEEYIVLSSEDLAELLHVSTRTLERLRKDNLIAYTMFRDKCRYSLSGAVKILNEE